MNRGPLVLIDATTLRTSTRERGIGRYLRELLAGLHGCRDEWASEFDVAAVVRLNVVELGVVNVVTRELDAVTALTAVTPAHADPRCARRLTLSLTALRERAALLHRPEPFGTPLLDLVPRVQTCHDLFPLLDPARYLPLGTWGAPWRRLQDTRRFAGARRVLAVSRATANDLQRVLRVPASRIDVVPNGCRLPCAPDDAAERRAKLAVTAPYLLAVGSARDPRKRLSHALAVFAEAHRTRPTLTLVLVLGAGVKERAALERVMAPLSPETRAAVRAFGAVEDAELWSLYAGAESLLLCSEREGFGYPALEAMALGCPVLAHHGSGVEELLGDVGALVAHEDVLAAVAALARLAATRDEQAARGRLRAERFDERRMARGHVAHYSRALAGA